MTPLSKLFVCGGQVGSVRVHTNHSAVDEITKGSDLGSGFGLSGDRYANGPYGHIGGQVQDQLVVLPHVTDGGEGVCHGYRLRQMFWISGWLVSLWAHDPGC
jgi:hypothetical protein